MKTKETKRKEAAERQARYDFLTDRQKLTIIKWRPGASRKESARIHARLLKEESK